MCPLKGLKGRSQRLGDMSPIKSSFLLRPPLEGVGSLEGAPRQKERFLKGNRRTSGPTFKQILLQINYGMHKLK